MKQARKSIRRPGAPREGQPDGGRGRRHGDVLRPVEAQPRLGAGRQEADQARPHLDASGQYGDSGQDDLRGMLAIKEFNAKGGVLGRKIECDHMRHRDQRRPPARASPSA